MTALIPARELAPTPTELDDRRAWAATTADDGELRAGALGVVQAAAPMLGRALARGDASEAAYHLRTILTVCRVVDEIQTPALVTA